MRAPSFAWFLPRWWVLATALLAASNGAALGQPGTLWLHSAIYDPPRQRMVLFGGTPDSEILENDTWQLTLGTSPQWRLLIPANEIPSRRHSHTAIYDPVRDRMLVFGGLDASSQIVADIWAFSLYDSTWSLLQPTGTALPSRRYHSAIYDSMRDRMIVFGGDRGFGTWLNDAWSLWLSPSPRWEKLMPSGTLPPTRHSHSAIYDPLRDRMLVFGGNLPFNDIWALTFSDTTWRLLSPTGALPSPRYGHSAIYDPIEDRIVVFGGFEGIQYLDDLWLLSLSSATPAWSRFAANSPSPSARVYHSAVYDATYRRMVVFGGTPSVTEPTWALSLGPSMRWSPARPLIEVAPPELVVPTVTVGDTASVPFSVSNRGLEPLDIQSFRLPAPELRVSSPNPPQLPWNTAMTETLWLAATIPGVVQDSLVILSNDPIVPRRQVNLRIDVRGLDFDTHVLGDPDSVAAGVSFIVVVTPKPGVTVERGTLYYRVANGSSPLDSLTLTPLATDFIGAIPASAVTEHGVEYYARVENSAFSATRPATAPATFFTQKVSSPEAIRAVIPRPTSGADFLVAQDIAVDVVLPEGAIFDSGTLHYRRGGEQGYESLPLTPTGTPGQTSATIPDSLVGPRGVEFWVEVKTLRSTLRYPASGPAPAVLRTKVPDLAETSPHAGGRYRLLTVPLDFGADFSGSLDGLLSDQLGTYDPTRWRAYSYDPLAGGNVEFSPVAAARFRPQPGRSFWLISRDAHRVDTKPVAGLSTSTASDYSIALAPGWNLIGNPFDFAVTWADVLRDPAIVDDPVAFDPSRGTIGDYADVPPNVLVPFEGYFIHATQAMTLKIPPREAPTSASETSASREHAFRSAKARKSEDDWQFRLMARTEAAVDGSNAFGVRSGAAAGFDPLDQRKPPLPPGPWVRAAFAHPEWQERSGDYRLDLRAPGSEGETWEVEVRSGAPGEAITLDLSEILPAAAELAVGLVDREQGTLTEWRPVGSAETTTDEGNGLQQRIVSFGSRPYRLAIAAGTEAYVARAAQQALAAPMQTVLDQNAPNPFRLATRVRFALPRAGRVSLQIYGILGERIATLMDGSQLEPGYHIAVWDGRRSGGGPVPSGVYLIRLSVEGETLTRRAVVVR